MNFCIECGSTLKEDGTCEYCTTRKEQDEANYEKQKSIKVIVDNTPRFGVLGNMEVEKLLESMKNTNIYYCPNCGKILDPYFKCSCGYQKEKYK